MLTLITSALLVLGCAQDDAAVAATDAKTELLEAAKKMAAVESYRFTDLSQTERVTDGQEGEGGGFGGRGGGQDREPTPTKGAWLKGQPMELKTGETLAYKEGEQVVYKDAEGKWQVLEAMGRGMGGGRRERPADGGGAGRGGERGGDDAGGGEGRGGRRGGEGDAGGAGAERRQAGGGFNRGLFSLMRVEAPHGMFADLGTMVADVAKAVEKGGEEDETVVFSGALTEEGAQQLGGRGGGRGFGGRGGAGGGGGGPEMETAGTYRIETKKGAIASIYFEITRKGAFGERTFETTTKRTVAFEGVGKTKYEVPEEALALFEI